MIIDSSNPSLYCYSIIKGFSSVQKLEQQVEVLLSRNEESESAYQQIHLERQNLLEKLQAAEMVF